MESSCAVRCWVKLGVIKILELIQFAHGELGAGEAVGTLIGRMAEAPFADAGGAVAGCLEDFRHRDLAGREGDWGKIAVSFFDALALLFLGDTAFGVFPDESMAGMFAC